METYAFWRPPVRTLTFEDFTTMQKQQGKALGEASAPHIAVHGEAEPSVAQGALASTGVIPTFWEQRQLTAL